jgi:hypothetical protein
MPVVRYHGAEDTMTRQQLIDIKLPKWPALVVAGKSVTTDQAAEIIIRTDGWWISCNDREWVREVQELTGIVPGHSMENSQSTQDFRQRMGVLDLEYLTTSRIASAYIGGPNGWCEWDGSIRQEGKNIGKWPSVRNVLDEWGLIARAFPFLDLTAMLFDHEYCEEDARALVEFRVRDGEVLMHEPTTDMRPRDPDPEYRNLFVRTERGCTIEQLRHALDLVRISL